MTAAVVSCMSYQKLKYRCVSWNLIAWGSSIKRLPKQGLWWKQCTHFDERENYLLWTMNISCFRVHNWVFFQIKNKLKWRQKLFLKTERKNFVSAANPCRPTHMCSMAITPHIAMTIIPPQSQKVGLAYDVTIFFVLEIKCKKVF